MSPVVVFETTIALFELPVIVLLARELWRAPHDQPGVPRWVRSAEHERATPATAS